MPKRKNRVAKTGAVWHRTAEEATLYRMPKFNAHACGTGVHGDVKYNRAKQKRAWQREMHREGARGSGSLLLWADIRWVCARSQRTAHLVDRRLCLRGVQKDLPFCPFAAA